jgi:hypothetical protein
VTPILETVAEGFMRPEDLLALQEAVRALEQETMASRLAELAGRQIELAGRVVPARAALMVSAATQAALRVSVRFALRTLRDQDGANDGRLHKVMVAASGAAGGALGFAALPIELPVSTTIMLRSIAQIARGEGEDLRHPEAALTLLQVLALGAKRPGQDLAEAGYFAVRSALALSLSEAARYIVERGIIDEAAPVILRLMSLIAGRFGLVVSQKFAAQSLPVIGAFGGAAVNLAFIEHFQCQARGHFTMRRLERRYGEVPVRAAYERARHAL